MSEISLHRANRILMDLRDLIKARPVSFKATVAVTETDSKATLQARRKDLSDGLERSALMLNVHATILGLLNEANASSGITSLLAKRSATSEMLRLYAPVPGVNKPREEVSDDFFGSRRRKAVEVLHLVDEASACSLVDVAGKRFENGESSQEPYIEVSLLTPALRDVCLEKAQELRRTLDRISDEIRTRNGTTKIVIPDDVEAALKDFGIYCG